MSNGYDPWGGGYDWSWMANMPGMGTLLGGGMPMGEFDPTQFTGGTQQQLQQILSGSKDYDLAKPGKYLNPMMEQAKMSAKGAKTSATAQLKASEGAGFDPAAQAYFGSIFDTMPAQQAPGMHLAAQQMTQAENAPLIAANTAMQSAAMQGLTNLSAVNQKAYSDMMGLKYSVQNQAVMSAVDAMTRLAGDYMSSQMQMMPSVSWGGYHGKVPAGMDPYQWFTRGIMGPRWSGFGQ